MAYVFSAAITPLPLYGVALVDAWDIEAAEHFSYEIRFLDAAQNCRILGCFSEKTTADNALSQLMKKRKELHPDAPRDWRPYIAGAAASGIMVLAVILALVIIYAR